MVESEKPLRALRDILADGNQGRGQVMVISRLEEGSEVELELKGSYSLTLEMINAVRAIPGIVETREI